jgi:hypothetical protein
MITISANTLTMVPLTLFEKTTLSGADYIMDLFSNQNHNHTLFYLTGDTTNNNARYNYFPVDVSSLNLLKSSGKCQTKSLSLPKELFSPAAAIIVIINIL